MKQPCVYILASQRLGTLYIGVTSDLLARLYQHRTGAVPGFGLHHEDRTPGAFEGLAFGLCGRLTALRFESRVPAGRTSKQYDERDG